MRLLNEGKIGIMCISELNYDEMKEIYKAAKFKEPVDLIGFPQKSFFLLIKNIIYNTWKSSHPNFSKYKDFKLNFGYSKDNSINAGAFHYNNVDFICIHEGTVLALYNHFLRALNFENVFPKIGDNKKICREEYYEPRVNMKNKKIEFYYGPKDEDRQDFAFLLATIGLLHISLHELGHHLNGHVLYDDNGSTSYCRKEKYISMDNIISQSMEMDADAFACTNSLIEVIENFNNKNMFNIPSTLKYVTSQRGVIMLWMIAITSVFLILGKDGISIENYNEAEYFPMRVREIINGDIVCKVIQSEFPELYKKYNREKIEKDFVNALKISESINCKVNGLNLRQETKEVAEQTQTEILEHVQYIHEYWRMFRKELEPYARIPLY